MNYLSGEEQRVTPLARRWNGAAAAAGMAGSEFYDEPERVFRQVQSTRESLWRALLRAKGVPAREEEDCPAPNVILAAPEMLAALQFVKQWLVNLEGASEPDDPLHAMRKKYHAPVHAEIDAALAKVKTNAVPDSETVTP